MAQLKACRPSQKKLCGRENCEVCVERSFAKHPKAQSWSEDNPCKPYQVLLSSCKRFKFVCTICHHESECNLVKASRSNTCRYCRPSPQVPPCNSDDCTWCFEHSFASHKHAPHWSPNNSMSPRRVWKSSRGIYKFTCDNPKCLHTFETALRNVSSHNTWCPYCCSPPKKDPCSNDECEWCFNGSFMSIAESAYWSKDNKLTPRQIWKSSGKFFKFVCEKQGGCGHTFEMQPNMIIARNHWCNFCKKLVDPCSDINCLWCFNNSFASHPRSEFWHSDNPKTARQVWKGTQVKYKFTCGDAIGYGHIFSIRLADIVCKNEWCSMCINKTEGKMSAFLSELGVEFHTVRQEWCRSPKTNKLLPFDFVFSYNSVNFIIEVDGLQHFQQVSNWKTSFINRMYDIFKQKCAQQHKYMVIRILQDYVWSDTNNGEWKVDILNVLNQNNTASIAQIIYLPRNTKMYDEHKLDDQKSIEEIVITIKNNI